MIPPTTPTTVHATDDEADAEERTWLVEVADHGQRLDRFLDENQKRIEEAPEQQQPELCVHLVGNIPPDKLEETLSRFRSSHAHVEIVIYDSEQISFPNNESDCAQ